MIVKIEGIDVNTGYDLDRNVKDAVKMSFSNQKTRGLGTQIYKKAVETLPTEGQDITVFDDDGTTLMFGGIITTISYGPYTPATGNEAWIVCNIQSDGYDYIPTRRTIDILRTNTDWGTIVEEMVDSYLIDEGVTKGTISTGATVDQFDGRLISIKEILDKAANASGYIWYIDNNKALQFVAPTTPTTSTKEIVEGERTHFGFLPTRSLNRFRNKQFFEGGQDSTGETIRVVVEDSADIASRASSEGNSGVYGNVVRDSTVQTETDATNAATELLNRYKPSKAKFSSWKQYPLGEVINVTYAKYGIATDTKYLIVKETISRDKHQWKYTYDIEQRDTTDFSSRVKDNGIDFFTKLAEKGTGEAGAVTSAIGTPLTTVSRTAIPLVATVPYRETITFNTDRKMYTMLTTDAEINCITDAKVDVDVYLDTVLVYSRKKHIDADVDTLNLHTSLSEVEAGEHTIDIDITSDTNGTMNDLKVDAQQFVNTLVTLPPDPTFDYTVTTTLASETYFMNTYVDADDTPTAKMVVDWGDGNSDTYEPGTGGVSPNHTYAVAGDYKISISEAIGVYFDFNGDTNIKSIDTQFPAAFVGATYGLFYTNGMFDSCTNLESLPNRLVEHVMAQEEWLISNTEFRFVNLCVNCTSLERVPDNLLFFDMAQLITDLGATPTGLNAQSAFDSCSALERQPSLLFDHITITSGGTWDMNGMFWGSGIKEARILKTDFSDYVVSFDDMYRVCLSLESIQSRYWAKTGASNGDFDDVFRGDTALKSIPDDMLDGNTNITDLDRTWYGCTGVLLYPNGLTDGCTGLNKANSLDNTFNGCTGMTNDCDDLWNDFPLSGANGTFIGCLYLSNYAYIPTGWK